MKAIYANGPQRFKKKILSIITCQITAMLATLSFPAIAQQVKANGTSITTSSGMNIDTSGTDDTDGVGLYAINRGKIFTSDISVTTDGLKAFGALSYGSGTLIEINGGNIHTAGITSHGAYAVFGGKLNLGRDSSGNGVKIIVSGDGGYGATAVQGSSLVIDGAVIRVEGNRIGQTLAGGVNVRDASTALLTDTEISTTGDRSNGIYVSANSQLDMRGGSIITEGKTSNAVALYAGSVNLTDVQVSVNDGHGVIANSKLSQVNVTGGSIATHGAGVGSSAAYISDGAKLIIDSSTVETSGDDARAFLATDSNSFISAVNTIVNTTGKGAHAIYTGQGASISLKDSVITTQGSYSAGILANGGSTVVADGVTVVVAGNDSVAVSLSDRSKASFENSHIISENGAALQAEAGSVEIDIMNNSSVVGGNGVLLSGESSSDTVLRASGNVHLSGNILAKARDTSINVGLSNNSIWDGSAERAAGPGAILDVALSGGSIWNMLGDSNVSSLRNADSTIVFSPPSSTRSALGNFKTLTVEGDYIGENGVVEINARLGGDDSQSDKLIIQGDSSGETFLKVNNSGGQGDFTYGDGIQVVQVDGASNGVFKLGQRVVAGSNEYLLFQGGKTSKDDGDWYLRSEAPEENLASPNKPSLYRPEIGAYLGNTRAAIGMFQHTLHERAGESDFGGTDGTQGSVWMRVKRNDFTGDTGAKQIDLKTTTNILQLGADVARWTNGDDRYHLGVMGATGKAATDVSSNILGYKAKGEVEGYSVGVYGTWFQNAIDPAGAYVDTWLQFGDYDNTVKGDGLARESYGSKTWAASVETGYAFEVGQGQSKAYYLEPQAQVIYTDFKTDKHREENGTTVKSKASNNVTTRLGARAYVRPTDKSGTRVQPFIGVNWWHSEDDNAMSFNDTTSKLSTAKDVYEVKVGAEVDIGSGWSAWGHLGTQMATGDQSEATGQFGVKYRW